MTRIATTLFDYDAQCRRNGILYDSELLLLILIGDFDEELITRYPRTQKFEVEDYEQLRKVEKSYPRLYVSPHILAEVSNLATKLTSTVRQEFFSSSRKFIREQCEVYVTKEEIVCHEHFPKIGVADTSILHICQEKKCVPFTSDGRLYQFLIGKNLAAINYEHFRGQRWFN